MRTGGAEEFYHIPLLPKALTITTTYFFISEIFKHVQNLVFLILFVFGEGSCPNLARKNQLPESRGGGGGGGASHLLSPDTKELPKRSIPEDVCAFLSEKIRFSKCSVVRNISSFYRRSTPIVRTNSFCREGTSFWEPLLTSNSD